MLDYTADNLNRRDIPFYMIESVDQLQYNQQDGMYDLSGLVHYRTARVYAMAKEELDKITPEEAAMRFYISDLERNVRVNLYPLYKKPLHGMNLTQTNFSYIKMVSDKLTERGYTLGRASIMEAYYPNRLLLAVVAAAAACGFVFVLNLLVPLKDRQNYILMALGIIVASSAPSWPKGPCSSRPGPSGAPRQRRRQPSCCPSITGKRRSSRENSATAGSSATARWDSSLPWLSP